MSIGTLAGTAWVNVLPRMEGFQKSVGKGLQSLERSSDRLGKKLTRNVTLPLVAAGAISVKLAVDFDRTFDQMVGLAGVSAKAIDGLKQKVLDLATVTGKAPEDLAKGLYFIESSGVTGRKALQALTVSAKLSAAGLGDTATVADAVTSAMNAYASANLSAAKAGDILAATVRDGKGEASAIAPVLGSLLPLSQRLGVSFDQVGASIASMTVLGTSAPEAATALQGFYTSLLSNSPKVVSALKHVGLTIGGLQNDLGNPRKGLPFVLKELDTRFHGNIQAMHEAFPNIRGLRALLALTGGNAKNTSRIFKDLAHSTGSTAHAFAALTQDQAFKLQKLKVDLQVLAIQIGTKLLPYVVQFAEELSKLIKWYDGLSDGQKKWLDRLVILVAVLGPALRLFALFIKLGRILWVTLKLLAFGIQGLGRALIFLFANPVGLIILAVAALVVGLILLYKHSERFRNAINTAFKEIAKIASAVADFIVQHWRLLLGLLTLGISEAVLFIIHHFKQIMHAAGAVISWIRNHWRLLVAFFLPGFGLVVILIVNHFKSIMNAARAVFDWIKRHWRLLLGILTLGLSEAVIAIVHHWDSVRDGANTAFGVVKSAVMETIRVLKHLWKWIQPIVKGMQSIIDKAGGVASAVGGFAGSAADAANSALSHLAGGGHLSAGQPALVGEVGPELWIPDTAGRIVSNNHMASAFGGDSTARRRAALVITNWHEGTGYFEDVADGSVSRAGALSNQRRRMRR